MANGLDALSPGSRTQYEALIPEIERSVRASNQARGLFYSGQAGDAETRAKADLLAKLAAQDTAIQATAAENEKNRATQRDIQAQEIKAGKRNALVNLLGAGVGSAATLGGLAYMNKPGVQMLPYDGKILAYDPVTKTFTPVNISGGASGAGGAASAPSGLNSLDNLAGPAYGSDRMSMLDGSNAGSAPVIGLTSPKPPHSIWQNMTDNSTPGGIFGRLGAGAAGGTLGYLGGNALTKQNNIGGEIGGAVGGLGGLALASKFSANPWAAGLGALFGAGGGSWLGNAIGRSL